MDILTIVNGAVVILGIPTIIGACIHIGRKLQILDSLNDSTSKMKQNMKVVSDYLTRHHKKFDPKELQAFSPFQLTDEGKRFIKEIGFDNVFDSHKKDFLDYIDGEQPKLKYEVENASIKSIHVLLDAEYMSFLKVFFYNNPARNMENTAPTLGVFVRDRYLETHPEITQ